jgi:hypothetical protein
VAEYAGCSKQQLFKPAAVAAGLFSNGGIAMSGNAKRNALTSSRNTGERKILWTLVGGATALVVGNLLGGGYADASPIDNVTNWNGSNYSPSGTYVTFGNGTASSNATIAGNNSYGIIDSTDVGGTFQGNFGANGTANPTTTSQLVNEYAYYFADTHLTGGDTVHSATSSLTGAYGYNWSYDNLSATGSITFSNLNNAEPNFEIGFFNDTFKNATLGQKIAWTNYVGVGFGFGNYNAGDNGGNSNAFRLQANGSGSQYVNAGTYDFTLAYTAPGSTSTSANGTDTITFYLAGDNGILADEVATASTSIPVNNEPSTVSDSANLYDFGIYQPRTGSVQSSTFNVSIGNLSYTGESNAIVPEPAEAGLLGIVSLAALRRRKRRPNP